MGNANNNTIPDYEPQLICIYCTEEIMTAIYKVTCLKSKFQNYLPSRFIDNHKLLAAT